MKKVATLFLGLAALGATGCREASGPEGNASVQDRTEVLAALDASGYAGEQYGTETPTGNFQVVPVDALAPATATAGGTVVLPALWAVRHGAPAARNRTVNITNDTARVSAVLEFNGQFAMIVPREGTTAQTVTKPAVFTVSQSAVLVKNDSVNSADSTGLRRHRWKMVQVSPQQWQMKDEAKRTTKITRVRVLVNGALKLDVTDPAQVYDVNHRMPRLQRGDVVQVQAEVSNAAGTGNTPPTFVFLHVQHADPSGVFWRRLLMQQTGEGTFQLSWVVRLAGRDRLVVQALDSQTFQLDPATDARGNAWGIPYRIE